MRPPRATIRSCWRLFRRADELGYDSLWLAEYHFRRRAAVPIADAAGGGRLRRTERMRVGTGVTLVPLHHPLILAEQLPSLTSRVAAGSTSGSGRPNDPAVLPALGIDPATKHARFVQRLRPAGAAWTDGRVASDDGPYQFPETRSGLRPCSSRTRRSTSPA